MPARIEKLPNEANLAQRIVDGDEEALRVFFDRYADPLFAFIYHHLGSTKQDAEEVWQTTLMASVSSMPAFRRESQLFSWLCAIARHKIADHRRRSGQHTDVFSDLPAQRLAETLASTPVPDEIITQRATRVLVITALAELPGDYRFALLERYIHERSVTEISNLLGRSYKATESLLSRARTALRRALESLEEKHGEIR